MSFFTAPLTQTDPEVSKAIDQEVERQQTQIELIASENIVSMAVLQAQGSVLTNKYAEGYPRKRYYGGCEYVDEVEQLAIDRVKELFGCNFANVQPNSGSQANQSVFFALLEPGDAFMGLALDQGGHITHGLDINMSGKWFKPHSYSLTPEGKIDYDAVRKMAHEVKPKLIISGCTCYTKLVNFAKFREIADEVGALLMADMAHISGLVAGGQHPSPFPHAHVVTSTTHKTLRGPRGGIVLSNDEAIAKKIDSAIFPGLQGGPLEHVIAGKAIAFGEALQPSFKEYAAQVVKNAKALGQSLKDNGINIVGDGTENHTVWIDLRDLGVKGNTAQKVLDEAGLTTNKNAVPGDPEKPWVTSGIRIGTPAGTTRGFGEAEFTQIGRMLADVLKSMAAREDGEGDKALVAKTKEEAVALCRQFPIYPELKMAKAA